MAKEIRYEQDVVIEHEHGLHMRPMLQLVETARQFKSHILVRSGEKEVDAKSILDVLTLAVLPGKIQLRVIAQGEDAPQAVQKLVELVKSFRGQTE